MFEAVFARQAELAAANVVAVPGVGFDVVPTDCLIAMAKQELPSATQLDVVVSAEKGGASKGTLKTVVEGLKSAKERRDGRIVDVPMASMSITVPFKTGDKHAVLAPLADVSSGYRTSGIPNIRGYARHVTL